MPEPLISVLLPCHDDGAYLDEAIQSVLSQTYAHFEIVIVDDGSSDPATMAKLDALRAPRCRVIRTENRGLPAARNLLDGLGRGQHFVHGCRPAVGTGTGAAAPGSVTGD